MDLKMKARYLLSRGEGNKRQQNSEYIFLKYINYLIINDLENKKTTLECLVVRLYR
jgi:hypothetical protein